MPRAENAGGSNEKGTKNGSQKKLTADEKSDCQNISNNQGKWLYTFAGGGDPNKKHPDTAQSRDERSEGAAGEDHSSHMNAQNQSSNAKNRHGANQNAKIPPDQKIENSTSSNLSSSYKYKRISDKTQDH